MDESIYNIHVVGYKSCQNTQRAIDTCKELVNDLTPKASTSSSSPDSNPFMKTTQSSLYTVFQNKEGYLEWVAKYANKFGIDPKSITTSPFIWSGEIGTDTTHFIGDYQDLENYVKKYFPNSNVVSNWKQGKSSQYKVPQPASMERKLSQGIAINTNLSGSNGSSDNLSSLASSLTASYRPNLSDFSVEHHFKVALQALLEIERNPPPQREDLENEIYLLMQDNEALKKENEILRSRIKILEGEYLNGDSEKKKKLREPPAEYVIQRAPSPGHSGNQITSPRPSKLSFTGNSYANVAPKLIGVHKRINSSGRNLRVDELSCEEPQPQPKSKFHLEASSATDESQVEIIEPVDNIIKLNHQTKQTVKLIWKRTPERVFIIKKPNDIDSTKQFVHATQYILSRGLEVFTQINVESELLTLNYGDLAKSVRFLDDDQFQEQSIDFIVCLGGDGTVIWASKLFPHGCPPILAFAMGSLGFLTVYPVHALEKAIAKVIKGEFYITLRSRLQITSNHKNLRGYSNTHMVLNEVVVDRGPSSSIVQIEVYTDKSTVPVTLVQGDGLIVSSPTGSTAYSLAAGGSMCHPNIPAMLMTPICPHSLSFRSILVPDSTTLRLKIPENARNTAWVSFDGKQAYELARGESIFCTMSEYPVPAIDCSDSDDWLSMLKSALHWNLRSEQKPFVDPNSASSSVAVTATSSSATKTQIKKQSNQSVDQEDSHLSYS